MNDAMVTFVSRTASSELSDNTIHWNDDMFLYFHNIVNIDRARNVTIKLYTDKLCDKQDIQRTLSAELLSKSAIL